MTNNISTIPQVSKEDCYNALVEARSMLVAQHPDFTSVLHSLVKAVSYRPDVGTAATDGTIIWVGPGFAGLPIQERASVLTHEIAHVMFDHIATNDPRAPGSGSSNGHGRGRGHDSGYSKGNRDE